MALIIGTALDDVLATTAAQDTLTALAGNDVVYIALDTDHAGLEKLDGGVGVDRLWFTGGTSLTPLPAKVVGFEMVQIADEAGNAEGTGAYSFNAAGVAAVSTGFTLTGNAGANALTGTVGKDTIIGGLGADTIVGGLGADHIVMSIAAGDIDQIDAGLVAQLNTLALVGAAPAVVLIDLTSAVDQVIDGDGLAQTGFANVIASGMTGFGVQVTGSAVKNVLVGSDKDDVFLYGTAAAIAGDVISGGAGNDTIRFTSVTANQVLLLTASMAVEAAVVSDAAGATTGMVTLGIGATALKSAIRLTGNDGRNSLAGGAGNDTLNGNDGNDSLAGGAGNDVYQVDDAGDWDALDQIADSAGLDDRLAFTSTTGGQTLLLNAKLTGVEAIYISDLAFATGGTTALGVNGAALLTKVALFGNKGDNLLATGTGKDTITSNGGNDTITSGAGADRIILDVASGQSEVNAGLATELNILALTGLAPGPLLVDLSVAAGADQFVSDGAVQQGFAGVDASGLQGADGVTVVLSALANAVVGSGKADVFEVRAPTHLAAADKLDGGADNDILRFASLVAGNQLNVVNANVVGVEIVDIMEPGGAVIGTTALNIAASRVTSGLEFRGNDGANRITSGLGNDTLNGNDGADTLVGNAGDDAFVVDDGADFVALDSVSGGLGNDAIWFTSTMPGDQLVLNARLSGIEAVRMLDGDGEITVLTPLHVDGTASNLALRMFGNDGDNTLTGGKSGDYLEGGKGTDSIVGGLGSDTIALSVEDAGLGGMDAVNAGAILATERNLLLPVGDPGAPFFLQVDLGSAVDQILNDATPQTGFYNVDASQMQGDPDTIGVGVLGSIRAESIKGSAGHDIFLGSPGADTIDGGGESDLYIVASAAELAGDRYNDTGGTVGDKLVFEYLNFAGSISILPMENLGQIIGIDGAVAGASAGNMNLNATGVLRPFSLTGNAGNNLLTGTDFGETIFDAGGGADLMLGRGGSDDYVILSQWVPTVPNVSTGDRIIDTGTSGFDELYYAHDEAGLLGSTDILVVNSNIVGIERFIVSSGGLNFDGPNPPSPERGYIRDVRAVNDIGIDISGYGVAGQSYHLAGSFGDNVLVGSRFNDTIIGWGGADTIIGGLGTDVIIMGMADDPTEPAFDLDQIDAGLRTENNRLVLTGAANGITVVDLSSDSDQVVSIDGTLEALAQFGFMHVDAAGVGKPEGFPQDAPFGAVIIGSAGANVMIGTSYDDAFVIRASADHAVAGESIGGGSGNDRILFDPLGPDTLVLFAGRMSGVERVEIADETGDSSGVVAANLNASALAAPLLLAGNDGVNSMLGTVGADTLVGNGGADTLNGGTGNDLYVVIEGGDAAGDVIGESTLAGGGVDTLRFISTLPGDTAVLNAQMSGLEAAEITDEEGRIEGDPGAMVPVLPVALNLDASAVLSALTLRGNDAANSIAGTGAADTITGNGGLDSLQGNGGADLFIIEMKEGNPDDLLLMDTFDDIDGGDIAEGNLLVLIGKMAEDDDPAGDMEWDLSSGTDQLVSINFGSPDGHTVLGITHLDASKLKNASIAVTGSAQGNDLIGTALSDTFITATAFVSGDRISAGLGLDVLRFTSAVNGDTLVVGAQVTGIEQVELAGAANLNLNAAPALNGLKITGNSGANSIAGSAFADVITVDVALADTVNGGAITEGNTLVLQGAAAGAIAVNLALADQTDMAGAQSGFVHVDASGVTGFDVNVLGTAGANRIGLNVAQTSALDGLAGNDTLVLGGTAAGTVVVDLTQPGDQVTSIANTQAGFENVDAGLLLGFGLQVTGADGPNHITGSAQADTIFGGLGADTIALQLNGVADEVDAGGAGEGNLLEVYGDAGAVFHVDLGVLADQLTDEATVQTGFQHVDARGILDFASHLRGNGLNNHLTGGLLADTLIGGAGADLLVLAGGFGNDGVGDRVLYERPADGASALAAVASFDRIKEFVSGQDKIALGGDFNGGAFNLDDISDNNSFVWANDAKANFSLTHEAMLITSAKSLLKTELQLAGNSLGTVAGVINKAGLGVIAGAGDDGLILVQAHGGTVAAPILRTGIYYYLESDGLANKVSAGELTLLGIVETKITENDVSFV